MPPLWFKAKRYGYGWYPCTWQGWVILLVFIALIMGYVFLVPIVPDASTSEVLLYLIPVWVITAILIAICWCTGEQPRWRWGGKD